MDNPKITTNMDYFNNILDPDMLEYLDLELYTLEVMDFLEELGVMEGMEALEGTEALVMAVALGEEMVVSALEGMDTDEALAAVEADRLAHLPWAELEAMRRGVNGEKVVGLTSSVRCSRRR